MFDSIVKIEGS